VGKRKRLAVQLDPYEPIILTASSAAMPALAISGPRHLRLGETGTFALNVVRPSPAAVHVFRLDVVDPSGNVIPHYSRNILSRNILAPNGRATAMLPLATNDKAGAWQIRVKDLLSGQNRMFSVEGSARC